MKKLNRATAGVGPVYPEKILQIGGGNFLRGFVDWMVDELNDQTGAEMGIVVVKPTERGDYQEWRDQEGLFHVLTNGIRDGELVSEKHLVKSISRIIHPYRDWEEFLQTAENPELRFIISNTTETGLRVSLDDQKEDAAPKEFPAKLTLWLFRRFQHFQGSAEAGCVLIPTELLVNNGELLKDCILQNARNWNLGAAFENWISNSNSFCNTLVDRIIPGVSNDRLPAVWEQLGFQDEMVTEGEPYHLWAIEAPEAVRKAFPIDTIGLNAVYTDDLSPFRLRKVRILNGAHTCMTPVGILYGIETVREAVENPALGTFIRALIFDEIMPTLDVPEAESLRFANAVLDRFKNPFIHHQLISISLNSISKFEARLLPSLLTYVEKKGQLPQKIVFSLAALIQFYQGQWQGKTIPLKDEAPVVDFFAGVWTALEQGEITTGQLVTKVLGNEHFWKKDLNNIPGLAAALTAHLQQMHSQQKLVLAEG